ncbi:hypothetical protein [Elizabethkingia anophelis]|uniref:hypothetical protein n=1 Tax=Elizabethkingia anophelis TaxID=1117645 RepID=UPI0021A8D863|nr:hypothetical protein [Elizabethkingia anophelis]
MNKTLLITSLWGILTLSIFYSCRTDSVATEQTQQVSEKIEAFERFEKANNIIQPKASSKNNASSEKYVSYTAPFAEIITNFLEKHSDYRERLEKEVGKIRLDVSSTTFGEGAKGVLFPVTDKNGKVIGSWAGIVNEERDYVKFYYLNNSSQEVTSIKNAFQSYYDRKTGKLASFAIASKNNIIPVAKKDVTEIEEVVITVTKPDTNIDLPWWWYDSGWTNPNPNPDGPGTGMDGGPGVHGGGTNGNDNNQQQDPCSKAKAPAEKATNDYKNPAVQDAKKAVQDGYNSDPTGNKSEYTTMINEEGGKLEKGTTYGGYNSSNVQGGVISTTVADIHNHNDEFPPSLGDVYGVMKAFNYYQKFRTRYVYTQGGEEYAIVVTDPAALQNFYQTFPPNVTQGETRIYTNFPGNLFNEWAEIVQQYGNNLLGNEIALAQILNKYNAGVAVTKKDKTTGDFKKLNVTENSDGKKTITNCN